MVRNMDFKDMLLQAKNNEEFAIKQITDMYNPLLMKESIIDGVFDEDLYQELWLTLKNCIQKIKI